MIDRNERSRTRTVLIATAAVLAALVALLAWGKGCRADSLPAPLEAFGDWRWTPQRKEAAAKCKFIWQRVELYGYSDSLAEYFIQRHYCAGVGPDWVYSLIYCWSGSGLNPDMVSHDSLGGYHARGLVDTLWSTHRGNRDAVAYSLREENVRWNEQVLHNPRIAIRLHLIEWCAYRDPNDPWRTARRVFLPSRPDSCRAYREQYNQWEPRMVQARKWLRMGYSKGLL